MPKDIRSATGLSHTFTVAADDVHDGVGEVILGHDWDWFTFDVHNTDTNALDQFEVQAKINSASAFAKLSTAWGTVTAHQNANTDLAALATLLTATARIRVTGLYSIQIVGSSDTTTSVTVIDWCLTRENQIR